jgi:hypothetical protein
VLALIGPTLCEPEVALLPDHPPLAVHDVALLAFQVRVELPPALTVVGLALNEMLGPLAPPPLAGKIAHCGCELKPSRGKLVAFSSRSKAACAFGTPFSIATATAGCRLAP